MEANSITHGEVYHWQAKDKMLKIRLHAGCCELRFICGNINKKYCKLIPKGKNNYILCDTFLQRKKEKKWNYF